MKQVKNLKNLLNKVKNKFPFLEKIFQNKLAVIPILLILPYFLRENYYLAKISVFAALFGTLLLLVTHFFGNKDHISIPIVILQHIYHITSIVMYVELVILK